MFPWITPSCIKFTKLDLKQESSTEDEQICSFEYIDNKDFFMELAKYMCKFTAEKLYPDNFKY